MEQYLSLLANMPLFNRIAPEEIPKVLACMQANWKHYPKGMLIRSEGDPADFIGIVLEGAIQVVHFDFRGYRTITASLSVGEMFGESISLAGISELPFAIQAVTDCVVLFLSVGKILQPGACGFHMQLTQNLLTIVSRKNMMLNRKLHYISRKTTGEKLLSYLDDQAKRHHSNEFTIPFDRQSLADYLGVERSAMAAEISKLQRRGVIETKRSWFRLLNSQMVDNAQCVTIETNTD